MVNDKYIQRCIQLAKKGLGNVAPNPMVGCVVVYQNKIIGEGFHLQYGNAHAEVNAINSVKNKSILPLSTVYVSLEPCAHFGKTPPCADLLIKNKVKKVVIGCLDINSKVAGKGIEKLKMAGIGVEVGVLEKECLALNEAFFTFHKKKRPYIILKWAETANGYIAGEQKQISDIFTQQILHQWRSQYQAFMVGTNTLLLDNPQLNNRFYSGKSPMRIAIDFHLKSENKNLCFYDNSQQTVILNGAKNEKKGNVNFIKIENTNVNTIVDSLYQIGIQSIVIEGGKALLQSFLDENLFDEIRIFKSKNIDFTDGIKAPVIQIKPLKELDLIDDNLTIYKIN